MFGNVDDVVRRLAACYGGTAMAAVACASPLADGRIDPVGHLQSREDSIGDRWNWYFANGHKEHGASERLLADLLGNDGGSIDWWCRVAAFAGMSMAAVFYRMGPHVAVSAIETRLAVYPIELAQFVYCGGAPLSSTRMVIDARAIAPFVGVSAPPSVGGDFQPVATLREKFTQADHWRHDADPHDCLLDILIWAAAFTVVDLEFGGSDRDYALNMDRCRALLGESGSGAGLN